MLVGTEDVTAKVAAATAGVAADAIVEARRSALTKLEQACEDASAKSKTGALKCERVTLYQGGQYWIYKYKRYEDVRLVFAPEYDIAQFGGDPDNFQFPRWCLDMSILRVYENDKPAKTPNHLRFNWTGPDPGDPTFVSGHPGNSDRLLTLAQLRGAARYLHAVLAAAQLRAARSPAAVFEDRRGTAAYYRAVPATSREFHQGAPQTAGRAARSRPVRSGRQERAGAAHAVAANPSLASTAGAWDEIAAAQQAWRDILVRTHVHRGRRGIQRHAVPLCARDRARRRGTQRRRTTSACRSTRKRAWPAVVQNLKAATPIYPDLEVLRLSFGLERMREWLGPDDPLVRKMFGNDSPDALANKFVRQTTLADPAARIALYEGGKAAVDASQDPLIRLAAAVDPEARALRKRYEEQVEGPVQRGQEAIAKARFAAYGTSIYPDATFTLRLSYGAMMGWKEKGEDVRPWTELGRAFERATGEPPFKIPARWLAAKDRLDMTTPANFTTNNDILGGNSGSPVVNAAGEIIGLAFDGNIHSIAGSYWFDDRMNRSVMVHPAYIRTRAREGLRREGPAGRDRLRTLSRRFRLEAAVDLDLVAHAESPERDGERRQAEIRVMQLEARVRAELPCACLHGQRHGDHAFLAAQADPELRLEFPGPAFQAVHAQAQHRLAFRIQH